MIGLQSRITVTVIRNAAGSHLGSVVAGCRDAAPTYYADAKVSYELPSGCGDNTSGLYDPTMPRKVINVMNYFGAPSSDFVPFYRTDFANSIDLQCELEAGDEIVCIWKPLLVLSPTILTADNLPLNIAGNRVVKSIPAPLNSPAPIVASEPPLPPPLVSHTPVTLKHSSKSKWLPTYGIYFQPPQPPEVV